MRRTSTPAALISALFLVSGCMPRPARPPIPERVVPIIPAPHVAQPARGTWIAPDTLEVFVADTTNPELKALGTMAVNVVSLAMGHQVPLVMGRRDREGGVQLRLIEPLPGEKAGSYTLTIAHEGIDVTASSGSGLFYGLQSLRQLFDAAKPDAKGKPYLPAVTIVDTPRFMWRGLHLDVARHFEPISFVKKQIDLMARYKLNTFHWHLTDDQGWRIEIRKYPRLTSVGGCRKETMVEKHFEPYVGDGKPYCGFYSQIEIRMS